MNDESDGTRALGDKVAGGHVAHVADLCDCLFDRSPRRVRDVGFIVEHARYRAARHICFGRHIEDRGAAGPVRVIGHVLMVVPARFAVIAGVGTCTLGAIV